ncbi:hypothetical protein [Neptuniibacter sp. 1_MG-2023]|uniref:hypothetical protein n=1 Tax=Neptuniibacter sp. 1_MG-2023 TaxID=3062662 RepID=UPI0026E481B0|nr:hypothetical protein [Neptuniibacter sp. 1_MG-2023]MDO6592574.1 hypothetical protein [Neptuniibacter sp. 1_MG-2023]
MMLRLYWLNRWFSALLFSLLWVDFVAADDIDWEVNGFVTQGFSLTDDNNFYGKSESGSFDFRELGISSTTRLSERFLVSGQLVSRRAGEVDDGKLSVDYALVDYRFLEQQWGHAGIQVGRVKNPFGFYNTTRDVAFTRPSIMLPQSLYFDRARNLELSSDGLILYGTKMLSGGRIKSELLAGAPRKDKNVEYAYLNDDWPGSFDQTRGYLWRTEYSLNDYSFIGAFTYGNFKLDFDHPSTPAPGAPGDGRLDLGVIVLSLQYNWDKWSLTGEYFRQDVDWGSLGGVFALKPETASESFYLQLEHRLTSELSMFARRDVFYIDKDDKDGKKAEALLGVPAYNQYAFDWTLGVGWEPSSHWLFRAEWHKVEGTGWLATQDNPDQTKKKENWDLFLLQATYRF